MRLCAWDEGGGGSEPLGGGGGDPVVLPTPGFLAPTSMFTFVVLVITIVICLCHVCFGHFKYLSAHNYKVWAGSEVRLFVGVACRAGRGWSWRGCWGMIGAKDRNIYSPLPGPLKIEHTETDAVSSRSNGRPQTAGAVPKSAVSALLHSLGWGGGGALTCRD